MAGIIQMKHLLFLLPLLSFVGCHYVWNDTPTYPPELPQYIPRQITYANDGIISWHCQDEEINPALVWVKCDFKNEWGDNRIAGNSMANSCIRVSFFHDDALGKMVAESRSFCSEALKAGETSTNYAAFEKKEAEKLLASCGRMLDECTMLGVKEDQ